jgi:hypothetical protein
VTTSGSARGRPAHGGIPRPVALTVLAIGAIGAASIVLRVGRRNPSHALIALFVLWVLSPFAGLLVADLGWTRFVTLTRATLDRLMVVVAVVSLVAYARVLAAPPAKPAAPFLIVPFLTWMLLLGIAFVAHRRR